MERSKNTASVKKSEEEIRMTYLMISIVAVLLVCLLTSWTFVILLVVQVVSSDTYNSILAQISAVLTISSPSINLVIYCAFNKQFRTIFFDLTLPSGRTKILCIFIAPGRLRLEGNDVLMSRTS